MSNADDNAFGEMPVSKTANEVTEEGNKGFWWKNMENYISHRESLFSVYKPQNSMQVVRQKWSALNNVLEGTWLNPHSNKQTGTHNRIKRHTIS